jgi:peptidylprolyl isomerase
MRFFWILVCLFTAIGCKSESAAPSETPPEEPAREAAPEAASDETEPSQAKPTAPAPAQQASPAAPDPNAPPNVAAAPENAKRSKSGLAWIRLQKGKGKTRPSKFDKLTLRYTGWTSDGRRFDSSENHGGTVSVRSTQLIPGMAEAVRQMVVGEKRRVWVPATLGYGEPGADAKTARSQPLGDLVFDIELVDVEKAPKLPPAPKDVAAVPSDASRSDSGLAWRVLEPGTGSDKPIPTSMVDMAFTIWTPDGELVDSSVLRDGVDTVGIRMLAPGWAEGMQLMVEGERRLFWVPGELAFVHVPNLPQGMVVIDAKLIQIRRELHQVQ